MLHGRFFAWFVREVSARSEDPAQRLLAVFDVLDHWFHRASVRGCAFINATVELADAGHLAHHAVLAHKGRSRNYFRDLAEAARLPDPPRSRTGGCSSARAQSSPPWSRATGTRPSEPARAPPLLAFGRADEH
jgi:hypothetical protein